MTGDGQKPNLARQKSISVVTGVTHFRAGTRRHPDMKKQARALTDREIDQLVIYYSTLMPRSIKRSGRIEVMNRSMQSVRP